MLNREFYDEHLPEDADLVSIANMFLKDQERPLIRTRFLLYDGLKFLSDFHEEDKNWQLKKDQKPDWSKVGHPDYVHEHQWSITIGGLHYKGSDYYLTNDGWPTGTICWYVPIESGSRFKAAGSTPAAALLRAVVVTCCMSCYRQLHPKARLGIGKWIEAQLVRLHNNEPGRGAICLTKKGYPVLFDVMANVAKASGMKHDWDFWEVPIKWQVHLDLMTKKVSQLGNVERATLWTDKPEELDQLIPAYNLHDVNEFLCAFTAGKFTGKHFK